MATYLLTWSPKRSSPDLQDKVDEFNEKGFVEFGWSVGSSKRVKPGDRVFLIRLGEEPKGIIGSGWAESDVYEDEHWDESKREVGESARYVDVRFDKLLNPDSEAILPRTELDRLGKMHWDSQRSGIQIPDVVAKRLEKLWEDFLRSDRFLPTAVAQPAAIEGLLTETKTLRRGRNRQLRQRALEKANGVCCVCDVDYKELLNGKGIRVLQVHHRKQLAASDTPRVTRLSDLAVVCANCHSLIHMNPRKALKVEKLRTMLGKHAKD